MWKIEGPWFRRQWIAIQRRRHRFKFKLWCLQGHLKPRVQHSTGYKSWYSSCHHVSKQSTTDVPLISVSFLGFWLPKGCTFWVISIPLKFFCYRKFGIPDDKITSITLPPTVKHQFGFSSDLLSSFETILRSFLSNFSPKLRSAFVVVVGSIADVPHFCPYALLHQL